MRLDGARGQQKPLTTNGTNDFKGPWLYLPMEIAIEPAAAFRAWLGARVAGSELHSRSCIAARLRSPDDIERSANAATGDVSHPTTQVERGA